MTQSGRALLFLGCPVLQQAEACDFVVSEAPCTPSTAQRLNDAPPDCIIASDDPTVGQWLAALTTVPCAVISRAHLPESGLTPEYLSLAVESAIQLHVLERRVQDAEAALHATADRDRVTAATMLQGVVHQSGTGEIIAMNPAAERILGKTRAQFIGSNSEAEDRDTIREDGTHFPGREHPSLVALETGKVVRDVVMGVFNPQRQEYRWIRVDAVPTFTEGQTKPSAVYAIFEDITEWKDATDRLRESEERYRALVEATATVVWRTTLSGDVVFASNVWNTLTGQTDEETQGWGWLEAIHPDDRARTISLWQESLTARTLHENEFRVRMHDGSFRWFSVRGVPVFNPNGTIREWVGANTDIHDQKEAQARSTDLNTYLQRAVAESHHRIKNNLQMLSALVQMQMPESAEMVPISEFKRIGHHILTLATLHDLLTLDLRVSAERDAISLKAALERLAPLLQETASSRPLLIDADDMTVSLKQGGSFTLLVNELVANALKHGRGAILVTLRLLPSSTDFGARAQLSVCDDGPGFPPDFDPKKVANTGLELIESLGTWDLHGTVSYENRSEGGARVVITFPLSD